MAEAAEEVEAWVALTQTTLGQFIVKPRMLTERLRKPPFRFLFDIAAEVARQTGFGLQELFGGELGEKPPVPSTREDKVSFLECWISLTSAMLGQQAPNIPLVSAQNIVCGMQPELTNYLLQCTAAAGWPDNCVPPAAPLVPDVPEQSVAAEAALPVAVDSSEPAGGGAAAAPPPSLDEQLRPSLDIEQARSIAAGMDFTTAAQEYDRMHEEFSRTTGNFNLGSIKPELGLDTADTAQPVADQAEAAEERPATGIVPLQHAAAVTQKVDDEIQRAADLLACIEEGLDEADAKIRGKRQQQQEAAEAAARAEAEAQAQLEEEARQAAEREAQKRQEKEAARARRKAEKEAQEFAAKFPMSKTSMGQSTRIICSVGEDEVDGDDGEEAMGGNKPEADRVDQAATSALSSLPMSACFTDDILGSSSSSSKPPRQSITFPNPNQAPLFERLKSELKDTFVSYLCSSMPESLLKKYQHDELIGCLQHLLTELRKCIAAHSLEDVHEEEPTSLAEDLHKQFPNDWLPHLQSATPWSLRQRYDLPELIDTLQGLAQTCFERLTEEIGPIAQWASESSPLRKPPAVPQMPVQPVEEEHSFAPACAVTAPALASAPSPLPSRGPSPPAAIASRGPSPAPAMPSRGPSPAPAPASQGPWSTSLGPAPWEAAAGAAPFAAPAPQTRGGAPPTAGGAAPPTRGGPAGPAGPAGPGPVFSSDLGPAPWELEAGAPGPAPATAARLPTGAGRMPTAQRPLMQSTQRPVTQQPPRSALHQNFAVTSR